jgi:hypothetical protein
VAACLVHTSVLGSFEETVPAGLIFPKQMRFLDVPFKRVLGEGCALLTGEGVLRDYCASGRLSRVGIWMCTHAYCSKTTEPKLVFRQCSCIGIDSS